MAPVRVRNRSNASSLDRDRRIRDKHICCGSAGTYSILQPTMANQLRDDKLTNLQAGQPAVIVTANIGCQLHLATAAAVPVRHWIELLDG